MIGIIDYGAGNLRSVYKAFQYLEIDAKLVSAPEDCNSLSGIVLPGVGAFGDGMKGLRERGLEQPLKDQIASGMPFLGICLGLQFLFEASEESPGCPGLGIFKGQVRRLQGDFKVPHMGWNSVHFSSDKSRLETSSIQDHYFYFVHTYFVVPEDPDLVWGETDYFGPFTVGVSRDNVTAVQFHPEKSQRSGLDLLKRWNALC
jgi:imidazole glycerol phosphate synthase glutamine amidotransferase subunit